MPTCRRFLVVIKNHIKIFIIGHLINLKITLLENEVLPKENTMTNNLYNTKNKKLPSDFLWRRLIVFQADAWYIEGSANANLCHICETFKWEETKLEIRLHFHYFLIGPRLKRLYALATITNHMRWHVEHHTKDGEMSHLSDAEPWLTFNATYWD